MVKSSIYTAADFFAGIGGIRLGFELVFGDKIKFVYASEIDDYARKTYMHNFNHEPENRDILTINPEKIPDFDILTAGFPCQPFSKAGKRLGLHDERGKLIFKLFDIIEEKKPQVILFENVRALKTHNKNRTFLQLLNRLEQKLGYTVYFSILNSKDFNVPQNRQRLYLVGFKEPSTFSFPEPVKGNLKVKDCLQNPISAEYLLSQKYLDGLKNHRRRHKNLGNGFGFKIISKNGIANTVVRGGMGKEHNLIKENPENIDWGDMSPEKRAKKNSELIRKLSPEEFLKIQGFPDFFQFPSDVPQTHRYYQVGNTVSVPVIEAIAEKIKNGLENPKKIKKPVKPKFLEKLSKEQYHLFKIMNIGNYISPSGIISKSKIKKVCNEYEIIQQASESNFLSLQKSGLISKITEKMVFFNQKYLSVGRFENFYLQ